MAFWAYMLKCADGRYYTGHTDDLERRVGQHQTGGFCKFTSTRRPVKLVWAECFPSRLEALEAERMVGGWSRAKKEALIAGDWKRVGYFAKPPRERASVAASTIDPVPFVSSEVEKLVRAAPVGTNVSTSERSSEACPERLPWQAVEGLDTSGGWGSASFHSPPFASSVVEKPVTILSE